MTNPLISLDFEEQSRDAISGSTQFPPAQSTAPILSLPPIKWGFSSNKTIFQQTTKLGDGYSQILINPDSIRTNYDIAIPNLSTQSKNEIVALFKQYGGFIKFQWRPLISFGYKEFVCDKWSAINQGVNIWEITATFIEQKSVMSQPVSLLVFEEQSPQAFFTQQTLIFEEQDQGVL